MMRSIRKSKTLMLLLLPFVAVQAQDDVTEEEPEIRRYTIEMIIFKYAEEVATGNEIFLGDKPQPQELPGEDEIPLIVDEPDEEAQVMRDVQFVLLENDDYSMGEIMGRLKRLDVYDPVMHFGWTQTTWPEEETQAIELSSLARPPAGLDGSLTLYLSRYLHLVVDLQLDAPEASNRNRRIDDPMSGFGDYRTLNEFGDVIVPGPVRYRINENRILRSGELRYFDHPKFGVLAKVTRVEEEDPEDSIETGDTELLGYPAE